MQRSRRELSLNPARSWEMIGTAPSAAVFSAGRNFSCNLRVNLDFFGIAESNFRPVGYYRRLQLVDCTSKSQSSVLADSPRRRTVS